MANGTVHIVAKKQLSPPESIMEWLGEGNIGLRLAVLTGLTGIGTWSALASLSRRWRQISLHNVNYRRYTERKLIARTLRPPPRRSRESPLVTARCAAFLSIARRCRSLKVGAIQSRPELVLGVLLERSNRSCARLRGRLRLDDRIDGRLSRARRLCDVVERRFRASVVANSFVSGQSTARRAASVRAHLCAI